MQDTNGRGTDTFLLVLLKPSHYDDDGYVIQWWRGIVPSNSLSSLYGLALDARDRQVLVLNAWEGLSGDDLAAVLGISRGGADAALSRARARLREQWEKREAVEGR